MKKTTLSLFFFLLIATTYSQSVATYRVTFNSIWNATDHTSVPSNAHWSKLVGATHKTPNTFLELGQLATLGIKDVAERGNNTVFNSEVNTEITNGEADQYINGSSLGTATGNIVLSSLQVDESFPLLTLVSMIAPSPDWFVVLNSYNLLDTNGDWKTSVTLDMFAYDAGTDSGTDYSSANLVTNPFQPISMINSAPINGNKMGTITIVLQSVLSVDTIDSIDNIKIYPNPTSGSIKISNDNGIDIKKVNLYNILGKMVSSKEGGLTDYDFSELEQGVYILKLISKDNKVKTQKLVIQ